MSYPLGSIVITVEVGGGYMRKPFHWIARIMGPADGAAIRQVLRSCDRLENHPRHRTRDEAKACAAAELGRP